MRTSDTEPDERLRALSQNIHTLIKRLGAQCDASLPPAPKACANARQLRGEIVQSLIACGFGQADVGAIAEAVLDGVAAALADPDVPAPAARAGGSAGLYQLRSFEVAVVGADAGAPEHETVPYAADASIAASGSLRVALRGARRMLLPGAGEMVRLRFSALTEVTKS